MSLFSKLRNCAIFFTLLFSLVSWSHTHTHTQKAYKAARTLARAQITVVQFSTFALTAWKYATFFICFCFTKFCDIKFFLLSLSLLFPARSCCCCCGCGPAFIPLSVCSCVYVCVFVCACFLWPNMAAKRRVRVLFAIFYLSFSRSIPLVVVLRWVYELYRFLCGRILFLFAIPLCIFFFCSSAFFLPFFCLLCRLAFFGCHKNVFLYVRRRYLAGRSSWHNVACSSLPRGLLACLALWIFSPLLASPVSDFYARLGWRSLFPYIIYTYIYRCMYVIYMYICMCVLCTLFRCGHSLWARCFCHFCINFIFCVFSAAAAAAVYSA